MIGTRILPGTSAGQTLLTWWPKSFDVFFTLGAIAAALIVAIWALQFSRRTAWLSERILQPRIFMLAGSIIGV